MPTIPPRTRRRTEHCGWRRRTGKTVFGGQNEIIEYKYRGGERNLDGPGASASAIIILLRYKNIVDEPGLLIARTYFLRIKRRDGNWRPPRCVAAAGRAAAHGTVTSILSEFTINNVQLNYDYNIIDRATPN